MTATQKWHLFIYMFPRYAKLEQILLYFSSVEMYRSGAGPAYESMAQTTIYRIATDWLKEQGYE